MNKVWTLVPALLLAAAGQAVAAGDAAAGKAKAAMCAACHGADGNSASSDYPRLAGQNEDYLAHALHAYKSGGRKNPIMAGMASSLSDRDIEDLAAWFASNRGLAVKK